MIWGLHSLAFCSDSNNNGVLQDTTATLLRQAAPCKMVRSVPGVMAHPRVSRTEFEASTRTSTTLKRFCQTSCTPEQGMSTPECSAHFYVYKAARQQGCSHGVDAALAIVGCQRGAFCVVLVYLEEHQIGWPPRV